MYIYILNFLVLKGKTLSPKIFKIMFQEMLRFFSWNKIWKILGMTEDFSPKNKKIEKSWEYIGLSMFYSYYKPKKLVLLLRKCRIIFLVILKNLSWDNDFFTVKTGILHVGIDHIL